MLLFFLSKAVPGDPIRAQLLNNSGEQFDINYQKEYQRIALNLNLDKPLFYCSLLPSNFSKKLNAEFPLERKKWIKNLLFQGFKYGDIASLRNEIEHLVSISTRSLSVDDRYVLESLMLVTSIEDIKNQIQLFSTNSIDQESIKKIQIILDQFENEQNSFYFPQFTWYGFDNQYHIWVKNLILGNGGTSFIDRKPVKQKIGRAMVWTFFLVFMSLSLSYGIGIMMGIYLSGLKNIKLKRFLESTLFGIYAIPLFWLATLLLVFFTTKEYGAWTNIFPSVGLVPMDTGERWFIRLWDYGSQLLLPCFCLVIHNLAFLASLTKRNIDRNKKLGFVRTLDAYGFSEREILYQSVLPHSLLPLITSITSAIPAALGGSLIIEIIFNIPGMGRLLYSGIINYDWPIVFATVMFIALITILSFFAAEIAYRYADPRIRTKIEQ